MTKNFKMLHLVVLVDYMFTSTTDTYNAVICGVHIVNTHSINLAVSK